MTEIQYSTFAKNVKLKPGQTIGFTLHKGYYAAGKAKTTAPEHNASPTSAASASKVTAAAALEVHKRSLSLAACNLLLANAELVHYPNGDVRVRTVFNITTMDQLHTEILHKLTLDCSQSASVIDHVSGAANPNRQDGKWDKSDGFTGTLLTGSKHIFLAQAKQGDKLVFVDPRVPSGHHVCTLMEDGSVGDPWLFSQGSDAGPFKIRLSEEAKYQPSQHVVLAMKV